MQVVLGQNSRGDSAEHGVPHPWSKGGMDRDPSAAGRHFRRRLADSRPASGGG